MVYHVIIALNGVKKRRVGDVISLLEKNGLELVRIRKKTTFPKSDFPDVRQLILRYQLNETEAMVFYRQKFSPEVLEKKINYFYQNHVELFFESAEKFIDPNELWKSIFRNVFQNGRKLPIMFVTMDSDGNGTDFPLIPDQFDPMEFRRFDPRTLVPLRENP